jgi:hypothetical protein
MIQTYRQRFLRKVRLPRDTHLSLRDVSYLTGIKRSILQQVYNRGVGAWKTNIGSVRLRKDFSKNYNLKRYPRSQRLTKEQWAMARVYSFVMGGKTSKTADRDLFEKI